MSAFPREELEEMVRCWVAANDKAGDHGQHPSEHIKEPWSVASLVPVREFPSFLWAYCGCDGNGIIGGDQGNHHDCLNEIFCL